jgi:two-component system, cell cycle response regulator
MNSTNRPSALSVENSKVGESCKRVLVAEDDVMFRKILQSWLQGWAYQVALAEDGTKAWDILQEENPPKLLILDWVMPGIDGTELCRRIRDRQRGPYQYILLVTAKDAKQDVVRGLDAGADDYLTKPFDRTELRARLRVGRRILTLQDDLIRAREELRFRATHDVLTTLWNRGALLELLQRELQRAARSGHTTGVLMLDLDHFKSINDNYGHLTGDVVLKDVANRISCTIRAYDLVGRFGGEEFLIVLPECDKRQLEVASERIRAAIADVPILAASTEIAVTTSVGGTVAGAGITEEKQLLGTADTALYRAKNAGRNRTVIM